MKYFFSLLLAGCFLMSCNNQYLELTPLTKLGETKDFWDTKSNLETFSNGFYSYIDRGVFTTDFTSDNCEHISNPPEIRRGIYAIPTALGSGGWNWSQLRNLNYFIQNVKTSNLDAITKNEYIALAKFFRASFYFTKVKAFGDVPWYSSALNTNDETEIFKPRDPRAIVMDSVLKDLDFAATYLPTSKFRNKISKWTALAMKSRIALHEGTYLQYASTPNPTAATRWLQESVKASNELINSNAYKIFSTGKPDQDYFELFQPKDTYMDEVILARSSDSQTFYYTPLFTSTSNGNYGATYSLIESYLMKDGKRFNETYASATARDTMSYFQEFQNRDPRLHQTIVFPGYVRVGTTTPALTDFKQNTTGYMIHKAVGPPSEDQGGGYRDVIIIRYAEILLNHAEAKAELNEITQSDLDQTINKVRARVALPALSVSTPADPTLLSLYQHTTNPIILEIRRERRIELAFEGFRKDDLVRWNEGDLFRSSYKGIYISGINKYIDLNNDGKVDLYVYKNADTAPSPQISGVQYYRMSDVFGLSEDTKGRIIPYNRTLPKFNNWEYFSPIPKEEITLNPKLIQNEGWK